MLLSCEPHRPSHLPTPTNRKMPLPSLKPVDVMLPYVLDATLIRSFKYWHQGVQQGMQYGHELYTHLQSYSPNQRNNAYNLAFEQMEKGHQICITVSKHEYGVWRNLRSTTPEVDHYDLQTQSPAQLKDAKK